MKNSLIVFFCVLGSLITIISCSSSDQEIVMSEIEDNWIMIYAERNGKETETLENAFFDFKTSRLRHNLTGDTVEVDYAIDGSELLIKDELIKTMQVKRLIADTLQVQLKISKFNFNFLMKKNGK